MYRKYENLVTEKWNEMKIGKQNTFYFDEIGIIHYENSNENFLRGYMLNECESLCVCRFNVELLMIEYVMYNLK